MVKCSMEIEELLRTVRDTDELIIGAGKLATCPEILEKHWSGRPVMLIADTNTWSAAGNRLEGILRTSGITLITPLIFESPPELHADYSNAERIRDCLLTASDEDSRVLPVAVGSGTVNDLVKRAAFEAETDYLCVGTAASMDGYCSSGAALSKDGRKQTMECPAPRVVLADTDVLARAPAAAGAAGYGDLASKLTAGADWIIADATGDDPIDEQTWNIVQPRLEGWLSSPELAAAGDPEALARTFEGLNFSGLAMQVLGRSRAASGAEHLMSHIWEMSGHLGADGSPVSHGFQVSLGILCVTALTDEVFGMDAGDIDIDAAVSSFPDWPAREAEIEVLMGGLPSWREYIEICRAKHPSRDQLRGKLLRLQNRWPELKLKVKEKLPPYETVRSMLSAAGCPVTPAQINMSRKTAVDAFPRAQCMRNRYTVLDLAYELGVFSEYINKIAESSVYLR